MSVAPPPGEHGGDGARLAVALGVTVDEVLDLSASLNPLAPDIERVAVRQLGSLRRYPDATDATWMLADAMGVDPGCLVLTNGGSEAIHVIADITEAGWWEPPEFSLYERDLPWVDRDAGQWRSNPNNPTGRLAPPDATAAVWDEAFWPLATGTWTRGDAETGAIVVGSLTKLFAAPGLRLGYVLVGNPEYAEAVAACKPEWSVNSLALAVLPELLAAADLPAWRDAIATLRGQLVDVLTAAGYTVDAADAPWVLVAEAGDLRDRLASRAILVRDCASFGMTGTVRIAVPDAAGLERLAAVIR